MVQFLIPPLITHVLINRLLVMLGRRGRGMVETLKSVASIGILFRKSIRRFNLPFRPQPSTDQAPQ
jgi:hypothetical protein